ncbi:D-alanine--D-alanine ligase [Pseudohongiella sp.]|uniref:ATP-grasp domain-containing protein n=1 Tax=marine sediment metagenome TaxID=412755 RepID=A0A0F9Y0R7_9ZZZZ|nr:D-alanine--D-alanine ligase [Pseudohongiella sp.]HDZ10413.1 D-alanine--D-alanine ligase [Pseudohongiella sp.]HEA61964.1 D-alanine--D-alanine ligase [Pseudohongiella sp.]
MSEKNSMASPERVAVLMGGDSAEREISLLSGKAVLTALQSQGLDVVGIDVGPDLAEKLRAEKIDRVFNILHGRGGEDGKLQGLLEMMHIPYTGSGVLASALAMDKVKTKQLWAASGLPTPRFSLLHDNIDWQGLIDDLGEVVVKPAHEGSSIGMSMASDAAALQHAYQKASMYDTAVMAEQRIRGAEFTVPVIHGEAFPAIELSTSHEFYDYDAKYVASDTRYLCPAPLTREKTAELADLCLRAFTILGAEGWGRVDVMQDQHGEFWLLELNTVPGMTDHSLVPVSAASRGLDFPALVLHILQGGAAGESS